MKSIIFLGLSCFLIVSCSHGGHHGKKDHHGKSCCGKGKMMKKMDKDGDGKISKDEFEGKHSEKWDTMDADKDGFITEDEMKAAKKSKNKKGDCDSCGTK